MDIQTITDKINYKTARVQKLQAEIKALEKTRVQLENEEIINAEPFPKKWTEDEEKKRNES